MTAKMTERDKKLLVGLGVFCVAVMYAVLVFMPLYSANAYMKEQIGQNEERIAQMEQKEMELPAVRMENEARKQQLMAAQEDLYPLLKSQEIDRILTEKTAFYGLSARRLQITMPDKPADVAGYGRVNDEGSNPDGNDGVWIAQVSLEAAGSTAAMDGLIDDISFNTPGIRITGLGWGSDRRQVDARTGMTEQYPILSLQLEVMMGRKD